MKEWLLNHQTMIVLVLGVVAVFTVFLLDERGPLALMSLVASLVLIAVGQYLFLGYSSENWLSISYGDFLKNVIGTVLMGLGWIVFLRGVLALAIAAMVLRMG